MEENNKETWKENNGDHSDRAWATVSLGGRLWVSPNDPGQENLQTFFQEVLRQFRYQLLVLTDCSLHIAGIERHTITTRSLLYV
jgi:hypothetical protein